MKLKKCKLCGKKKYPKSFGKDIQTKDKLTYSCKDCLAQYKREVRAVIKLKAEFPELVSG
jgi:ribosome-binding protein aMBF1 (putative translation factor)